MSHDFNAPTGKRRKVLITALEPSADAIGAAFIRSLRKRMPNTAFIGCGGPLMAEAGFQSLFPTDDFAVIGVGDVLRVLTQAFSRAKELAELAATEKADAAIFIDGWLFARLCAVRFKKYAPQTVLYKLAAPQVWASRPERVDFVASYFDGVMCLFPFEPPLFEKAGARSAFVGNPNFQLAARSRGDGNAFRLRHQLSDKPILTVLLGSRRGEVKRLAPIFGAVVQQVAAKVDDLVVVTQLAPAVRDFAQPHIEKWGVETISPQPSEKFDAFAATTAALAVSGTVTTELAINGAPMVVAYRVENLTALWLWRAMKCDYASIINIAANKEILPEFLQLKCRPSAIVPSLLTLLTDEKIRTQQIEEARSVLEYLDVDGEKAEDRAAVQFVNWFSEKK